MCAKLAVLTGATGGIGGAILARLVAEGHHVLACGRNREKLAVLKAQYGSSIDTHSIDFEAVGRKEMADLLDVSLRAYRYHIDALICAHGAAPCIKPMLHLDEFEDVRPILDTDILGTFVIAQVIGQYMVAAKHGSMVFVSSAHAHASYPCRVPYAVAKSGICAMARALAVEFGQYNVRINTVSPWQVSGERSNAVAASEQVDTLELYRQSSPLRRLVTAQDVADAVMFVAQNESMSGQDVRVDCGVGASMWHQPFLGEPHVE